MGRSVRSTLQPAHSWAHSPHPAQTRSSLMVCAALRSETASTTSPRTPCSLPRGPAAERMASMAASTTVDFPVIKEQLTMKHAIVMIISGVYLGFRLSALAGGGGGGCGGGGGGGVGGGCGGGSEVMVNPDPDFRAGMAAVGKEDWKQVEVHMTVYVARSPGDADAWNELGHAQRKMGNMDAALSSYDKALKINPKHRGAHEYLGEAYLQMGDLARAEQELKVLDKLCFLPCEQYSD